MKKNHLVALLLTITSISSCVTSNNDVNPTYFKAESKSQMLIVGANMYVISNQELKTYSLGVATEPELKSTINIGFDMLSITADREKLYIGTFNSTYVYSIINPWSPEYLTTQSAISWCNAIAFEESYLYTTSPSNKNTGNTCGIHSNTLAVYNIDNSLHYTYDTGIYMEAPSDLVIKNTTLYMADYKTGLCVFDLAGQINAPFLVNIVDRTSAFTDCTLSDDNLYMMNETGFTIYDISEPLRPRKLSQNSFQ